MYPHLIHTVGGKPVPNTFTVESVIIGDTSRKGSATLSVNGDQSIAAPLPVSNGGTSQSQAIVPEFAGDESGFDLMYVRWTDSIFATKNGPNELSVTIDDSIPGNPLQTCGISTSIEGIIFPTPIGTVISRSGSYDGSVCNTRCTEAVAHDTANIRFPVLSVHADSLTNMRLSIAPNQADSTFYTVCVIDSMLNGSAMITLTDIAGDTGIERYAYCTIADTLPPLIKLGMKYDTARGPLFDISDNRPWDRGLDSISVTNLVNLRIDAGDPTNLIVRGLSSAWVSLVPINGGQPQSLCIKPATSPEIRQILASRLQHPAF